MRHLSKAVEWCKKQTVSAILFLLLISWLNVQSEALTTFGKSNTQAPRKIATTAAPPARICSRQAECAGISSSSCVRTQYDPQTRCLCGDNQPPVNGQCGQALKALYHACGNSDDCNDGLICGTPNMTGTTPAHLRVHSPQDKICLCDHENGFVEKDHTCSDADILQTSLVAILIVSCMRKLLTH